MPLVTLRVVRERLGVSDPTLRRMERAGQIKFIRLSPRIVRVEESEVERVIAEASAAGGNSKASGTA